jgi:hypothetical protein
MRVLRKLKREEIEKPLRVHDGACRADLDGGVSENDRADRGERRVSVSCASTHAAPRMRVQTR